MTTEETILAYLETGLGTIAVEFGLIREEAGGTAENVFRNLEYQTRPDIDAIIVFPGKKTSGYDGDPPACLGELNNYLPVSVQAFVDDDLRGTRAAALKAAIEQWLVANDDFGGNAEPLQKWEAESVVPEGGDPVFGFVQVGFTILFITQKGEV
jgi:hypothetical protein